MSEKFKHEHMRRFLQREKNGVAESTYENRQIGLSAYQDWLEEEGYEPLDVDSHLKFTDFIYWCIGDRGVSDRTAYQYLTQVWRFYQYLDDLAEDGAIEAEPVVPEKDRITSDATLELTESEREKHINKAKCALSPDEMDTMIEHAQPPEFKSGLVMRILGQTGIRPKELRDLKVGDIDDDYEKLHVRSSKTHTHRTLGIPPKLAQNLRIWLEHGYRDACAYADKCEYLIPGEYTDQLGERTLSDMVADAAEAAGIQEEIYQDSNGNPRYKYTPYSFRYGYAIHMIDEGVAPKTLQKLMGHKNVQVTLKYYTLVSDEELVEASKNHAPEL